MIPKKFRDHLADLGDKSIMIVESLDPCIEVWPESRFDALYERTINAAQTEEIHRYRTLLNQAAEVPVDKPGRLLIPAHLRRDYGLIDKVTFVGDAQSFQLWEPSALGATVARARSNAHAIRSNLSEQGVR